jgi:hypothetical protein
MSLGVMLVVSACIMPEAMKVDDEGAGASAGESSGGSQGTAGASGESGGPTGNGGSSSGDAGMSSMSGASSGGEATAGGAGSGSGGELGGAGEPGSAGQPGSGGEPGAAGSAGAGGASCSPGGIWPDSTPHCSDGGPLPCPLATEDGNLEAATPSYTVTPDHIADELTGLVWERSASLGASTYNAANNYCNGLPLDGFDDWRLPTLRELITIADYGLAPSIAASFSQDPAFFWTSSPHPVGANHSGINFSSGLVASWPDAAPGNTNTRCVRGTLTPGNLELTGEIVIDPRVQLEWQAHAGATTMTWEEAIADCADLGDCWRLPTVKELLSIFAPGAAFHLPPPFAANEPAGKYWSSTPYAPDNTMAWNVDFSADATLEASAEWADRLASYKARCVRGSSP